MDAHKRVMMERVERDRATIDALGMAVEVEKIPGEGYVFRIVAPTGAGMMLATLLTVAAKTCEAFDAKGIENVVLNETFLQIPDMSDTDPKVMNEVAASVARGLSTAIALKGMITFRDDGAS